MKTLKKSPIRTLFVLSFLFFSYCMFSQDKGKNMPETSITLTTDDTSLKWNAAPDFFPGCSFTILHGDMAEPNLDLFFKIEPNTEVINHTHNSAERMILISGELEVQYEGENSKVLKPGTYAYGPANKPHRAKCLDSGPCVLFIALVDPFNANPIAKKH